MESPELINRLDRIEKLLISNKKVLTLEEAADFTGYKPSYLYKLTSAREIPYSKPKGGALFFNKEKLESWMQQNEVKSKQDIESKALAYTLKKRKA